MPDRFRRVLVPVALVAAVVLFYWKLVFTGQYTWVQTGDHLNLVLPWWQEQAGQLREGRFPLWDPWSWGGQPLAGQGQPGAFYPLNWPLFLAPLKNGWIRQSMLHAYFVLTHALAAWLLYLLARELGRSRAAGFLAACVFSLGGYIGHGDGPQMMNGGVWAPAVFLFLFRWTRTVSPADAALSGAALGLSWLSGHPQAPLLITLAATGTWFWLAWQPPGDQPRARVLTSAALALLVAFLIAAVQILPLLEYGRHSLRFAGADQPAGFADKLPYTVHGQFAWKPEHLFGIVIPRTVEGLENPFLGFAAALLAGFGIWKFWRDWRVRTLAALGLAAVLFALGPNSLLHGVLYALVPLLDKARVPGAANVLFSLAAACLAAFGLDRLLRRWPQAAWVAPAVVLFELYAGSPALLHLDDPRAEPLKAMSRHADIAAFLRDRHPARFTFSTDDVPYNLGEWYSLASFNGFTAGVPAALWQLQPFSERTQRLMGVRYHVGTRPPFDGWPQVFAGKSGLKVFESRDALPRAWIVHQVGSVGTLAEAAALVNDAGFHPPSHAFLVGTAAPQPERCQDSTAEITVYEPDRVAIRAEARCRGLLVLSDSWFPGWQATVGGKPAPILPAYGALRGVVIDGGVHEVELRYRPSSVAGGAGLSFCGLAVLGIALWRSRRVSAASRFEPDPRTE